MSFVIEVAVGYFDEQVDGAWLRKQERPDSANKGPICMEERMGTRTNF